MKIEDAIKIWENENIQLIEEIRDFKASEYKNGMADGIEIAIESLKIYLEKCKK